MADNKNSIRADTVNGKVLPPLSFFVVKATLKGKAFVTAKAEVIKRDEDEQLEGVKRIFTNNGITDIFLNLPLVNKDIDRKREFLAFVHTTAKGNEIKVIEGEGDKKAIDVINSNKAAAPVYLFLAYKLTLVRKSHFQFDLNEYFDFYKMERRTESVRQLEKGLEFLAHLHIRFTANYNGKSVVGSGNFLAYNVVCEGKGKRNYVSVALMDWSKPIIENINQYMLIDGDILAAVDQRRFPKIITIIYKLYDRFRNNLHKRKEKRQEVISVKSLILEGLGITEKQLKKRGYEDSLYSLERHLHHLEDLGFIQWRYEKQNGHESNRDCYEDNIVYQINNEVIIKKYAELAKSRGRKGKTKKKPKSL